MNGTEALSSCHAIGLDVAAVYEISGCGLIVPIDILLPGCWTRAQPFFVASAADGDEDGQHLAFGYAVTRLHA